MKKQKFYVVWIGREKGIFTTWETCKTQIDSFEGAKFKSFETIEEAEIAFNKGWKSEYSNASISKKQTKNNVGTPILNSISVDGAWNTKTGMMEYQGVYTQTKKRIFHQGPFADGTNNIAEFLAIVHALAYCKKQNLNLSIYSDSVTAMAWVRNKHAKTQHTESKENEVLFELIDRAENWLKENSYSNKILKWETEFWGEIPADFGRK